MFTCAVNSRSQHICDHWILLFYFYQIADKTNEFKNAHKRSLQSAKYLVTKKGNGIKSPNICLQHSVEWKCTVTVLVTLPI